MTLRLASSAAALACITLLALPRDAHATDPPPASPSAGFVPAAQPRPLPPPPAPPPQGDTLAPITVAPVAVAPVVVAPDNAEAGFSGGRMTLEWLAGTGALAGGYLLVVPIVAVGAAAGFGGSGGSSLALVSVGLTLMTGVSLFAMPAVVSRVGYIMGGRGGYGWAILGASIGIVVPGVVTLAGAFGNSPAVTIVGGVFSALLPGLGSAIAYELSSGATVPEAPSPARAGRRGPRRYAAPSFNVAPLLLMQPGTTQLRVDTAGLSFAGAF